MGNTSTLEMALGTGPVVKLVLIILVLSSVISWTVIFIKWLDFKIAKKDTDKFLDLFWNAKSLDSIFAESKTYSSSPVSNVFRAGYLEFQKVSAKSQEKTAQSALATTGIENVQRALKKSSLSEGLRLEKRLPWLSTIASAAPFIGLFGTVWGIMDAFQGLSSGGPATIQRVAPGISEALIATAVGLAAAIPAVIAYNHYIQQMRGLKIEMENFASDFTNILKRNFLS